MQGKGLADYVSDADAEANAKRLTDLFKAINFPFKVSAEGKFIDFYGKSSNAWVDIDDVASAFRSLYGGEVNFNSLISQFYAQDSAVRAFIEKHTGQSVTVPTQSAASKAGRGKAAKQQPKSAPATPPTSPATPPTSPAASPSRRNVTDFKPKEVLGGLKFRVMQHDNDADVKIMLKNRLGGRVSRITGLNFSQLIEIFGLPSRLGWSDDDKSHGEWFIQIADTGFFSIYDYKAFSKSETGDKEFDERKDAESFYNNEVWSIGVRSADARGMPMMTKQECDHASHFFADSIFRGTVEFPFVGCEEKPDTQPLPSTPSSTDPSPASAPESSSNANDRGRLTQAIETFYREVFSNFVRTSPADDAKFSRIRNHFRLPASSLGLPVAINYEMDYKTLSASGYADFLSLKNEYLTPVRNDIPLWQVIGKSSSTRRFEYRTIIQSLFGEATFGDPAGGYSGGTKPMRTWYVVLQDNADRMRMPNGSWNLVKAKGYAILKIVAHSDYDIEYSILQVSGDVHFADRWKENCRYIYYAIVNLKLDNGGRIVLLNCPCDDGTTWPEVIPGYAGTPTSEESGSATERRGRGRPPGSKNKPKDAEPQPRRGRGRPPGSKNKPKDAEPQTPSVPPPATESGTPTSPQPPTEQSPTSNSRFIEQYGENVFERLRNGDQSTITGVMNYISTLNRDDVGVAISTGELEQVINSLWRR
jgi:hypothetical protein